MLEQRVERLEGDMKDVKATLKSIEEAVIEIRAELKHLPKITDYAVLRAEVGEIKGRLGQLPTTWQLLTFTIGAVLAASGLAFTIARFLRT